MHFLQTKIIKTAAVLLTALQLMACASQSAGPHGVEQKFGPFEQSAGPDGVEQSAGPCRQKVENNKVEQSCGH